MAKKHVGRWIALAAVVGTAAAAISYYVRYRAFSKELDEDFHDFEGDDDEFEEIPERTYVTLPPKVAEAREVIKEATGQAVNKAKNAAAIMKETVKNAADKARGAGKENAESETVEEAAESTAAEPENPAPQAEADASQAAPAEPAVEEDAPADEAADEEGGFDLFASHPDEETGTDKPEDTDIRKPEAGGAADDATIEEDIF